MDGRHRVMIFNVKARFEHGFTEYLKRLETFDNWTYTIVNKYSLARLGFTYSGIGDKVKCEFCDGKLYNWEFGDDPWTEHKRYFPQCPYILQLQQDNTQAAEPQYQDLVTRVQSYPHHLCRTPNELATAGFYFAGYEDRVRCFHCGVVLWDWGCDDDPFDVHRSFSPACVFIRNITEFQQLGITNTEACHSSADDISFLGNNLKNERSNDPEKQKLIDSIRQDSSLFQQLLGKYDKDTIFREMVVMIQRYGRNFKTYEEFVCVVANRREDLCKRTNSRGPEGLRAENDKFRQEKACIVCKHSTTSIVFLPCGHLVTCACCACGLLQCPMCQKTITGKMPVYRP